MAQLVSLRVRRRAILVTVCTACLLAAAPLAHGQEQPPATEPPPAETVPTETAPAPDPDPAPVEQPPAPEASQESPPSDPAPSLVVTPPPPEPAGPTAEELAAQGKGEREQARKKAERLRKQRERAIAEGFAAFLNVTKGAPAVEVPTAPEEKAPAPDSPVTVAADPAAQTVAAALPGASGESSLSEARPVVFGLLALALALLGLCAAPVWLVRSAAIAGLLVRRRLEIGLTGTAILAIAGLMFAIAVAGG